jgi:hypothetical protein
MIKRTGDEECRNHRWLPVALFGEALALYASVLYHHDVAGSLASPDFGSILFKCAVS